MNELIAIVWSFSNEFAEIPYKINRTGYSKKEGGNGITWSCSCPHFVNRGGTCKHLINLRKLSKDKTIKQDKRYELTEYGKKVLKINE